MVYWKIKMPSASWDEFRTIHRQCNYVECLARDWRLNHAKIWRYGNKILHFSWNYCLLFCRRNASESWHVYYNSTQIRLANSEIQIWISLHDTEFFPWITMKMMKHYQMLRKSNPWLVQMKRVTLDISDRQAEKYSTIANTSLSTWIFWSGMSNIYFQHHTTELPTNGGFLLIQHLIFYRKIVSFILYN